jgi:hypothetical protein
MSNILANIGKGIETGADAALHFVENLLGSSVGQSISETVAELVTGVLFKYEITGPDRITIANFTDSVANGVYTLCDGKLPAVNAFTTYLGQFTDGSPILAEVVTALGDEYASLYADLEKDADAAKAIAFFMAVAKGVEAAAAKYATPVA